VIMNMLLLERGTAQAADGVQREGPSGCGCGGQISSSNDQVAERARVLQCTVAARVFQVL
jgi:hypothetical protein